MLRNAIFFSRLNKFKMNEETEIENILQFYAISKIPEKKKRKKNNKINKTLCIAIAVLIRIDLKSNANNDTKT